jgi:hypothetical protein
LISSIDFAIRLSPFPGIVPILHPINAKQPLFTKKKPWVLMLPTAFPVEYPTAQSMGIPPAHIMNIMNSARTWMKRYKVINGSLV